MAKIVRFFYMNFYFKWKIEGVWSKRRKMIDAHTLKEKPGDHQCFECALFEEKSGVCCVMVNRGKHDDESGMIIFENIKVHLIDECHWKNHPDLIESVDLEEMRHQDENDMVDSTASDLD